MTADAATLPRAQGEAVNAIDIDGLAARFHDRTAKIGVIGLGFDIDRAKVELLNAGRSYQAHIEAAAIAALRRGKRFEATGDFSRVGEVDAIMLCVPTPLTRQREPDLSFIV